MRNHLLPLIAAIALLVAACSSAGPTVAPTAAPAAFDVAAVRANFTDECRDPAVVDELFCEQVDMAGMNADDDILYVPTSLNAEARDRAEAICNQLVFAHFDAEVRDLGYEFVGILDQDGGNVAACSVD